jgi:2-hydroxychromene-2-carboxylate isomerase
VLTSLGKSADAILQEAQGDAIKTALRAQTEEAQRLGIFGAPSFVTQDGELFWGNDRLEAALDWAKA